MFVSISHTVTDLQIEYFVEVLCVPLILYNNPPGSARLGAAGLARGESRCFDLPAPKTRNSMQFIDISHEPAYLFAYL